jgi:hypothetical protein
MLVSFANVSLKSLLKFIEIDLNHSNVLVDGNWAQWSDWTSCDVTCGNGSQSRFRTCTNPTQTANGRFCTGSGTDISICKLTECQGRGDDIKGKHHAVD